MTLGEENCAGRTGEGKDGMGWDGMEQERARTRRKERRRRRTVYWFAIVVLLLLLILLVHSPPPPPPLSIYRHLAPSNRDGLDRAIGKGGMRDGREKEGRERDGGFYLLSFRSRRKKLNLWTNEEETGLEMKWNGIGWDG